MSFIYNVTIEHTSKENRFHITWQNSETNTVNSFDQEAEITPEETERLWQWPQCQLDIGKKLFHFLDGEAHHFQQALKQANQQAGILQLNLNACKQTSDWPFELLATAGAFLLPNRLHLVRTVSDWGAKKGISPQDRPLKLLFMACSALDVQPELDFEREEEAIFKITEKLAIDMDVEDSGSLEGLREKLVQEQYDVVHLSGHADIDKNGRPYFIMEDETGYQQRVFPDMLWEGALIENPPRLLFLSGCRTGETPGSADEPENTAESSFARLLVEKYNIPAVLGWGRSVSDDQASHAGKMIFYELSRGRSILDAIQRARYELLNRFPKSNKPAWPLLRLFSSGVPLNAIVKEEQKWKPKVKIMTHVFLKNSQVKVLMEGFVGRRRQVQTGLRALKQDNNKVGLMLLGTGGLGKSCLAGKICERFSDHTLIIVHGRFNIITLESALMDAFIMSQDEKGLQILSQKKEMAAMAFEHDAASPPETSNLIESFYGGGWQPRPISEGCFLEKSPLTIGDNKADFITDMLARLCVESFKEKNYLLLLDDFEQNTEGADKGQPGPLLPEAEELLKVLLHYLPFSGKMTQLIITSRYEFSLTEQGRNLVEERLEKVWLTSFQDTEKRKKLRELENIYRYKDLLLKDRLLSAGHGNPRLMEWMDILVGQMKAVEVPQLFDAVKDKQEEFINDNVIRVLLQRGGKKLELFLQWFSVYRRPVLLEGVMQLAEKAGLDGWKGLLREGMSLGLAEHDQVRQSYQVTPLLREDLLRVIEEPKPLHESAFKYYWKICEARDSIDPLQTEEWIFHALGCGKEDVASDQGGVLVSFLRERLAFQESRRVGEWVLAEKKQKLSTGDDGFLLFELAYTMNNMGDHREAINYGQQALGILKNVCGEENLQVAAAINNLGSACKALGDHGKAITYYQQALDIMKNIYGETHQDVATTMNNLGSVYHMFGDYNNAIDYYQQALTIWKNLCGEKHTQVAASMNNLGLVYDVLGDHSKAIDYYQQALDIDEAIFGREHPKVALRLNNLGETYLTLGNPRKAIDYFKQVLAILKNVHGDKHPLVAMVLNNLGVVWENLGDYRKAIDHIQQALDIDVERFRGEHPKIALRLNNLGEAWRALGDFRKAIDYIQQALDINKAVFGGEHPDVAKGLNNLGAAYHLMGDTPKAIDYYRQALAIDEAVSGREHPNAARELNNMGLAWSDIGDYHKAIDYCRQAFSIWKKFYGEKHPQVAVAMNNLGSVWIVLGEARKAIDYIQQAFDILEKAYGENNPKVATVMNNLGAAWDDLGDHHKAIDYYNKALAIDETVFGREHVNVARELNNLGLATENLGDPRKAINYFHQALEILKNVYGEKHPQIADTLNNLGSALQTLGDPRKAIEYIQQALDIDEEVFGQKHPQVALRLNNLGTVWNDLGDYRKAIDYYQQALVIWRKFYGEKHPQESDTMNNLGSAVQALGDPHKAIEYIQQALDIDEAMFGAKHPRLAIRLNNLGEAWRALGEPYKAIDYYQQALAIDEKVFGPKHPRVALKLNNLGLAWEDIGDYSKAIDCFQKAFTIDEAVFGREHPKVAIDLNNLGGVWKVLGEPLKAIDYHQKALAIQEKFYYDKHPQIAVSMNNLGAAWDDIGDPHKAIDYYQQALAIDEASFDPENPKVALRLNNLGAAWKALGVPLKAIVYYREALPILKKVYGDKHPLTATVMGNIGSALHALGDLGKAIDYLQQALSIARSIYGDNHPKVAIRLSNLGAVYFDLGKRKEAKDYFEKAYTIFIKFFGKGHPNTKKIQKLLDACKEN